MKYMTVSEAAGKWGISARRVSALCKEGSVPGAVKRGKFWMIPEEAEKPADRRMCMPEYHLYDEMLLPLPVGVSDYKLAVSEYYYVDKTLMIRDFLDDRAVVSLFTRPRRFGKTLNMDMMRVFFEKTEEDTSVYFRDKAIWQCGEKYQTEQGKYPVIFLTFKDIKRTTWDETYRALSRLIATEYRRHGELAENEAPHDRDYYRRVAEGNPASGELELSLQMLTRMLHDHYGVAPVVIIDEYDTPIQQGYFGGFYDEVILFIRNLFSGCFKDNPHLSFGLLTGILRVAKESIFSGMNNPAVNSILENKYSAYFGFTAEEVRHMAGYYHAEDKFDEICDWYDGYRFGRREIFNPWSVINYFRNEQTPGPYWVSTSNNEIIGDMLAEADDYLFEQLRSLLRGEEIVAKLDTGIIYPEMRKNPDSVFGFLMIAGYLKPTEDMIPYDTRLCGMKIPNREILSVYRDEILRRMNPVLPERRVLPVQMAMLRGDCAEMKKQLGLLLMESVSCFDTAGENFYHGFMLGLTAAMVSYRTVSNRESGLGRFDIMMTPLKPGLPGIVVELKADKTADADELQNIACEALNQINEKHYDTELRIAGITDILKYGVAFSGKQVEVVTESLSIN